MTAQLMDERSEKHKLLPELIPNVSPSVVSWDEHLGELAIPLMAGSLSADYTSMLCLGRCLDRAPPFFSPKNKNLVPFRVTRFLFKEELAGPTRFELAIFSVTS